MIISFYFIDCMCDVLADIIPSTLLYLSKYTMWAAQDYLYKCTLYRWHNGSIGAQWLCACTILNQTAYLIINLCTQEYEQYIIDHLMELDNINPMELIRWLNLILCDTLWDGTISESIQIWETAGMSFIRSNVTHFLILSVVTLSIEQVMRFQTWFI